MIPELVVDLDTFTTELTGTVDYSVTVETATPGVSIGIPGPHGPVGLVKVVHGADPNVARPVAPLVYWVGTVQPIHGDPDDLLMLKET